MTTIYLVGYHSCKNDNGYEYIIENAPFLSGSGSNQWLSQGYYFWTDSPFWALRWPHPNANKVVSKFDITISSANDILDLVGNVDDQLFFHKLIVEISEKIKSVDNKKPITVNQVINYLRFEAPKNVFPYLGVKAEDNRRPLETINFIDPTYSSSKSRYITHELGLIKRQQLCVFASNSDTSSKNNIKLVDITYPEDFSAKFKKRNQK
ncbi:GxxExxY protein [Proteus faecis]|uniref:GxxExxY protein n=1 Tax=Proteus faecis TaxID=2050967 RepID=UPI0021BA7092|nr:GxxExxY protein [Proteus faecis]MCT8249493.1 GxxExxY protein [Proteus faecis]